MTFAKAENLNGRLKGAAQLPSDLPMMLDANQSARLISTSPKFIRDQCNEGKIKAVKCGRVWRINRDAFLEQFGLN